MLQSVFLTACISPVRRLLERNEAGLGDELLAFGGERVVDELLGVALRLAGGEEVEFAGDRPRAVLSGLGTGLDAVHDEALDLAVEVAHADVANGVRIAGNGLNDAAGGALEESALGHAGLAHDEFLPGFERAGGGVAADHDHGSVGTAEFLPVLDLAGEEVAQLLHRKGGDGVLRGDDRDDGVKGDRDLDRIDAVGFEVLLFLVLEVAARHGHIGHLVAERLDAVAGTRAGDRHDNAGVLLHEGFGNLLHDRKNRRGAVEVDRAGGKRRTAGGKGGGGADEGHDAAAGKDGVLHDE